ncbi:MAG: hypothetical protein GSR85_02475 [Desulfurococcales archaeon]|nr:hypothetical protein [Desulfurococcales archaeon]
MPGSEGVVLARAVELIINGRVEEALEVLSSYYGIPKPRLKIGLPKGCLNAYGCYNPRRQTIYVRSSEEYMNPFIILHEYYHHLRGWPGVHRGSERHADEYALNAIRLWRELKRLGLL